MLFIKITNIYQVLTICQLHKYFVYNISVNSWNNPMNGSFHYLHLASEETKSNGSTKDNARTTMPKPDSHMKDHEQHKDAPAHN